MSREVVAMPTALWRDANFASMNWQAQRLYFLLSTQPDLNQAGYIPMLTRRWAGMSAGGDVASIQAALDELVANEWAWVDDDHEEVLVRRHTAPAGHKQIQGALQATFEVASPRLRQIAVAMLSAPDFMVGSPRTGSRLARMRVLVYARDAFTCQRCGWAPYVPEGYNGRYALGTVSLDPGKRAYQVRLLELDHVFPESLGGLFEYDNLQTLCNSCNASKGARVA